MISPTDQLRAEAEARVVAAQRAVERQKKIAATYRKRGIDARDAEERLNQLEGVLARFEKERAKT